MYSGKSETTNRLLLWLAFDLGEHEGIDSLIGISNDF